MLFPVLIIVALLMGAFSIATMITLLGGNTRESVQSLVVSTGRKVFLLVTCLIPLLPQAWFSF